MSAVIRASRLDDGPALRAIERAAGEQFREVGLSQVADDEPFSTEALDAYAKGGRSWVAVDDRDQPTSYVVVDVVDGNAHVEQLSVHPDWQGTGLGRALLDRVEEWAAGTNKPAITLTTFTDVAWNRPLYEHLGFSVITGNDIGPELAARRAEEAAHGLAPETRVCMRLVLDP